MPITNISSSNTFGQFRQAFNDAANAINLLPAVGASLIANSFTANNLTSGRVALVGASGLIQDDSGLTYNTSTDVLTVLGGVTATNLTSGRVALVGASGLIQDDSGLTYNTSTDALTVAGGIITSGITATSLTSGRVALVGTSGTIQDDSGLTYNTSTDVLTIAGAIVSPNVTATNLTSGRVAIVGASGIIQDDSGLTYNPTTDVLTIVGTGGVTANNITANNITANTITTNTNIIIANTITANTITANTITANAITANTFTANNLTSGRVALVGTSGTIQDDAGLTYNPTTDVLTLSGTTDSTSSGTGTLIVAGGVGVAKNLYVSGNTFITGNLTVLGSNSELSTTQINVNDSLIQLANNNTSDLVDIGVFGQYNSGAANLHSGIFRDSTDGIWKLFKSYNQEPTTKISPSSNNFAYADLNINSLTANSFVYLNNQNVLRFGSSANANYVGLRSNSAVGSNVIWTLPNLDGSANQVLTTNGSGGLSFANNGAITTSKSIALAIIFGS
jgi:hypothetical protein